MQTAAPVLSPKLGRSNLWFAGHGTKRAPGRKTGDGAAHRLLTGTRAAITLPAKAPSPADKTTSISWSTSVLFGAPGGTVVGSFEVGVRYAPATMAVPFLYCSASSAVDPTVDVDLVVPTTVRALPWGSLVRVAVTLVSEDATGSTWKASYFASTFASTETVIRTWRAPKTKGSVLSPLLGESGVSYMFQSGQYARSATAVIPSIAPGQTLGIKDRPLANGYSPRISEGALRSRSGAWLPWDHTADPTTWAEVDPPYFVAYQGPPRYADARVVSRPVYLANQTVPVQRGLTVFQASADPPGGGDFEVGGCLIVAGTRASICGKNTAEGEADGTNDVVQAGFKGGYPSQTSRNFPPGANIAGIRGRMVVPSELADEHSFSRSSNAYGLARMVRAAGDGGGSLTIGWVYGVDTDHEVVLFCLTDFGGGNVAPPRAFESFGLSPPLQGQDPDLTDLSIDFRIGRKIGANQPDFETWTYQVSVPGTTSPPPVDVVIPMGPAVTPEAFHQLTKVACNLYEHTGPGDNILTPNLELEMFDLQLNMAPDITNPATSVSWYRWEPENVCATLRHHNCKTFEFSDDDPNTGSPPPPQAILACNIANNAEWRHMVNYAIRTSGPSLGCAPFGDPDCFDRFVPTELIFGGGPS